MSDTKPVALIFSPNFEGHRQVYVFVLAHLLRELHYQVVIAGSAAGTATELFYINSLLQDKDLQFADTSSYERNGLRISNSELVELQHEYKADVTIIAEADNHIQLLVSQISNKDRLKKRTIGIFLRPFYFYQHQDFIGFLRYLKGLRLRWKSDERLFHSILMKRFHLLDVALHLDENFVSHHPHCRWLPDMFQQYAETILKDRKPGQQEWIQRLKDFREANKGRFLVLYFGSSQARRGYDRLLRIALEKDGCFVHCGLADDREKYEIDVLAVKTELARQGRILETNEYITDPTTIESFFKAATHLILPYQSYFYGSSGVMLQALDFGIPVLVPDRGIMGYRVKKYNLGLTYNETDESLENQFSKFIGIPQESFTASIQKYMEFQSVSKLKQTLKNAIMGEQIPVAHP